MERRGNMKKIISVFLVALLLLGMIPSSAAEAAGDQPFQMQNASAWKQGEDSNGVYYETLSATAGELTYQQMLSAAEGVDVTYDIQAVTWDANCVNSCVWVRDTQTKTGFYARVRMTGSGQHQIRGQYYDGSNWHELFNTNSWVSGNLPGNILRVNIVLKDGQVNVLLSNRDGQVQGQYTSSAIPASFFESTQTKFYFETDNKGLYRLGNFYGLWERELPPTTVSNVWKLDGSWLADSEDTKLILNEKTSSEDAVWKTPVDMTQEQTISMDWVTDTQIGTNNTWGEQLAIKFQQPDSQDYLYIRLKRYRNDRGAYQMYLSTQYYLGGNWSRDVFDRWCDSNGKLNQIGIKIERNAEGLHIKLTDLENDNLLTDSLLNTDQFNSADIKNAYTSVILAGTALQMKVNVPNENTAGYYLTNPVMETPEDPEETLPEETNPDMTEPAGDSRWDAQAPWSEDAEHTMLILTNKVCSSDAIWKTAVDMTQEQTISMDWVTNTQIETNSTWGEQVAIKFQQPDSEEYVFIRLKRYRNDRGVDQLYLSGQYYHNGNWSNNAVDQWCTKENGKLNRINILLTVGDDGLHIKLTDKDTGAVLTDSLMTSSKISNSTIAAAYAAAMAGGTQMEIKINVPDSNTAGYYLTNPVMTDLEPEDPEVTEPDETEPDVTEPDSTESLTSSYWELTEGWAVDAEDTKLILAGVSANGDAIWKTPLDMTANQRITMQWLTESEIVSKNAWGEQLALKLIGSDSEDYLFIRIRRYYNDRGAYQIHLSAQYYYQNDWSRDVLDRWCDGTNLLNQIGIQMTVHNGKIGIQLTDLISGAVLTESTLSAEQFPEGDIRDAVSAQIFCGTEVALKVKALEGNTAPYTVTNPVTVPYEPEPEVEPVKSEVWELVDGWTVDEAGTMLLLTEKEAVSEAVWKQTLDLTQSFTLSMDWVTSAVIETKNTWGEQVAIKLAQPGSEDYLYIRLKRYRNDKGVEQLYVTVQYYYGGQWSENVVAQWGTKSNKNPLQNMTLQLTRQTAENNLRIKVIDKDTGESLVSNAFTAGSFKNSAVGTAVGSAIFDGTAVVLKIDSTKENTAQYYLTNPVVGAALAEPKTFTDYGWHNDNDNFTGWTLISGQSFRVSKNRAVTNRVWKEVVSNQKNFGISADVTINQDSSIFVKVKGARFELDSRNGDGNKVYLKINNKGDDWIAATDGQVNIKLVRQDGGDLQIMITGKDNPEPVVFTMALTEPDNRNFEVGIYAGSATFRNIRESTAKLDIQSKNSSAYWDLGDGWAVNMADTELMLTKADTGAQAQWKKKLNMLQNQNLTLIWKPEAKAEVQQIGFALKAANIEDYLLVTLKRTVDASGNVHLESGAQYLCGGVWSEQVIGNKIQTGEGEITLKLTVDGQKGSLQVQLLDANNQQVLSDRVLTADMFADMNTGITYRDTITKSNSVIFGVVAPAGNLSAYRLTNPVIQTVSAEQPEETQPGETKAPAMFGWENYKNDFTGWSFVSEQEFSVIKDEALYNYVSKKLVEDQEKFKISLDVALDTASCAYVKLKGVGFELDNRNGGITIKPDGQEKMSLGASDGTLQIVLYRYEGDIQVTVTGKDSGKTLSFALKVGSAAGDKLDLGVYDGKASFRNITGTNDVTPHAGGEKSGNNLVKLLTVTAAASLTVMAAIIVILLIKRKKAKKA